MPIWSSGLLFTQGSLVGGPSYIVMVGPLRQNLLHETDFASLCHRDHFWRNIFHESFQHKSKILLKTIWIIIYSLLKFPLLFFAKNPRPLANIVTNLSFLTHGFSTGEPRAGAENPRLRMQNIRLVVSKTKPGMRPRHSKCLSDCIVEQSFSSRFGILNQVKQHKTFFY